MLSKGTVRRIQMAAGLWIPRKLRPVQIQQPRARRACFGELVQVDGCEHRWFEEGAPGPAVTEVARRRFAGATSLRQLFLCRRGRPPFLPFSRELIALRAEVLEPA